MSRGDVLKTPADRPRAAYATRKGWTVADEHVYVDDGVCGAEFANRPGFLRLMNAVKPRPPFQVLVMSEESRLGREAIETAYALKQLVAAGVRVFFYLEDRERTLDSPTDKIMLSLTAFADELEREKARQRTYDAMLRKAKAGHVTGGRVFGYDNVEVLGAGRQALARRATGSTSPRPRSSGGFSRCRPRGYGMKAIAKTAERRRAPSPRAQQGRSQTWAPVVGPRGALPRPLPRRDHLEPARGSANNGGSTQQTARPEASGSTCRRRTCGIVSEDAWAAAHARLEAVRGVYMKRHRGRPFGRPALGDPSKYLLTNLALCGCCGGPLRVRSRERTAAGAASTGAPATTSAGGRSAPTGRRADGRRGRHRDRGLLDDMLDPDMIEDAVNEALGLRRQPRRTSIRYRAIEAEIARIERERDRLVAAIAAGGALDGLLAALRHARRGADGSWRPTAREADRSRAAAGATARSRDGCGGTGCAGARLAGQIPSTPGRSSRSCSRVA